MPKVEKGGASSAAATLTKADKAKQAEIAKKEKEKAKADAEKAKVKEKMEAAKAKAEEAAAKAKELKEKAKEEAKAKREELAAARKKAKEEKAAAKKKEPVWVEQLSEKGEPELVDKNKFPFEVVCSVCGSVRYVTKSGLLLVDKCKLHAKKERRKHRMEKVREKGKKYRAVVKDALEQGLFSDAFKKKHGL